MKMHDSQIRTETFPEMSLSPNLMGALAKMKIEIPTQIQAEAIPVAMSGTDLIAVAQTGSGKTLAYALPLLTALEKDPAARGLILAPNREVAEQIYRVFMALTSANPVTIALVVAGQPNGKLVTQLNRLPRLIVATPGRMFDHLKTNKLLLQKTAVIVIDEADRMLDMGFSPQLQSIRTTLRGEWQTMMFSASFNPAIESVAKMFMLPEITMIRSAHAEKPVQTLEQKVFFMNLQSKGGVIVNLLRELEGGVLIFTDSQESCVEVGEILKQEKFASDYIHGGLTAGHRNRVIREFHEGRFPILVTTDLLARGLDFPFVDHVISFELPYKSEDFLHRIGRTARAGRKGYAYTFLTPSDGITYKKIRPYLKGAFEVRVDSNFRFNEQ